MIFAGPVMAAEQTAKLSVPGMTCASCPFIVEAAIRALDGVSDVKADYASRTAVVIYDDALTSIEAVQQASVNAGYEAIAVYGEP